MTTDCILDCFPELYDSYQTIFSDFDTANGLFFPSLTNSKKYFNSEKSLFRILTSKFEGLPNVLLEAQTLKTFIISSDCPTGPREILNNGKYGFLFESNCDIDFKKKVLEFLNCSNEKLKQKKINAKKQSKKFSLFHHSKELRKILNNI